MADNKSNPLFASEYTPKALDTSIKTGVKTIMSNIGTLIAIMCVMLLVAVFLFDVSLDDITVINSKAVQGFVLDSVITVILYIVMQNSMIINGEKNGQLDKEFIEARKRTIDLREWAKKLGCPKMGAFCDRYIYRELENTRERRLTKIPMKYSEWSRVFGDMTSHDIKKLPRRFEYEADDGRQRVLIITHKVRLILRNISSMKEQRFTPEMMMYDDTNHPWRRIPLLPSPSERIREKRRANYIPTIVFSIMSAMLVFKFVASPTWGTAIYCLFKLFGLMWRGAAGYSIGFLAYSVHGVQYYQSQEIRFHEYKRWLELEDGEDDAAVFDF